MGPTTIEHLVIYNIEENTFKIISDASAIGSLKYSYDGKYLATCFNDSHDDPGTVVLYNTETWEVISLPNSTHSRKVNAVAFSPDNTMLASVGYDGAIKIWNITDNQLIKEINSEGGQPPVWSCVFTQDSKYIFYSNGIELIDYNNLKIWSIENLEFLKECPYPGTSQIFVTSENHYSFLRSASYIYLINPNLKPSDIDELYEKETLLYPNPTSGIVNLTLSVPENTYVSANIINAAGIEIEIIYSGLTVSDELNLSWDSSDYSSGMYWCRIEGSDFTEVYKFVVVK